jgi:hypothetical protein
MPQRKEDYMSTRNPGGNRRGGTDATPNDPFSYVKLGPSHGYLGHFRAARYLEEGHNQKSLSAIGARQARRLIRSGPVGGAAPGTLAAKVAAERPVIAAKMAAKAAVRATPTGGGSKLAAKQAGRAAVLQAKLGPSSRVSQRAAVGGVSSRAGQRLQRIARRLGR